MPKYRKECCLQCHDESGCPNLHLEIYEEINNREEEKKAIQNSMGTTGQKQELSPVGRLQKPSEQTGTIATQKQIQGGQSCGRLMDQKVDTSVQISNSFAALEDGTDQQENTEHPHNCEHQTNTDAATKDQVKNNFGKTKELNQKNVDDTEAPGKEKSEEKSENQTSPVQIQENRDLSRKLSINKQVVEEKIPDSRKGDNKSQKKITKETADKQADIEHNQSKRDTGHSKRRDNPLAEAVIANPEIVPPAI